MTLIGAAFVVICLFLVTQGDTRLLSIMGIVFGLAVLLVGAVQWRSVGTGPHAAEDERGSGIFVIALLAASVLLGLASLGVFVLALVDWNEFGVATTARFPRPVAVVAGAVGTLFFIGGPIALVLREGRSFGQRANDGERDD